MPLAEALRRSVDGHQRYSHLCPAGSGKPRLCRLLGVSSRTVQWLIWSPLIVAVQIAGPARAGSEHTE
jgi:hypothetical protein